mmetsp:Transcript_6608/g.14271  ORF Transcript_6608/g.14271 Transcript_6608/m.14271 type:complete len:222 (-) Transcript_6608:84-749(-)
MMRIEGPLQKIRFVVINFALATSFYPPTQHFRASASNGDRKYRFRFCVSDCLGHRCLSRSLEDNASLGQVKGEGLSPQKKWTYAPFKNVMTRRHHIEVAADSFAVPSWLQQHFLSWDCRSECQYHCMVALESYWKNFENSKTLKYYGKWPFKRICGLQEFVSSLLSIGNLWPHLIYLVDSKRRNSLMYGNVTTSNTEEMERYWMVKPLQIYWFICFNTWIW